MSKYQVYIVRSGDGARFNVMEPVVTLEEAMNTVHIMDSQWTIWSTLQEKGGYDKPVPDYLHHYEGCDVYVQTDTGVTYAYNEHDEWELLKCPN
jgi:hypothetical protein